MSGVVTTLKKTINLLEQRGHQVTVLAPDGLTLACPTYPDIRLSLFPRRYVSRKLRAFRPDAVHIVTEGPIGYAARSFCLRHGWDFTTSFHTQFPEYINLRFHIPTRWTYGYLRRFHVPATRTMVNTKRVYDNLEGRGFPHLTYWSRGVDTEVFKPRSPKDRLAGDRPVMLYVGRVAVEKNLEAFLTMSHAGSKVVIGGGPDLTRLRARYPDVRFTGPIMPPELGEFVASADVFVFPSLTDTFGIVMIEAMACGVPVAAYPVQGPIDVVRNGVTGCLDEDLSRAVDGALTMDPDDCVAYARQFSWEHCTNQFEGNLVAARGHVSERAAAT